jgi:hypothetical protein
MNLRHFFTGAAISLAVSGAAAAQGADGALLQALGGCAGLSDNAARLACYDRLAPQVKAALAVPAATAAAPPSAPEAPAVASAQRPTEKDQSSWFGFDMGDLFGSSPKAQTTPGQFGADQLPQKQASVQKHEIDSITAGLQEYAKTPFGKFIVFLDNGQIWRQLQGDDGVAYFPRDLKGVSVEISRGLLGSYNMHLVGSARTYKVERVK